MSENPNETLGTTVQDTAAAGPGLDELHAALSQAQAQSEDYKNQALRAQAEMENIRRRHVRELEQAHKYALEKFIAELLPVKDNLERGLAVSAAEVNNIEQLRVGMELTLKQLQDVLLKAGVQELSPLGQRFNPELHQAMGMQVHPELSPNTVLTVYQKGYTLNERLVRPAMVIVAAPGSGQPQAEAGDQKQGNQLDEMA